MDYSIQLISCKSKELDVLNSFLINFSDQWDIANPTIINNGCNFKFSWDLGVSFWHIILSCSTEIVFTVILAIALHLFYSAIPSQSK